MIERNERLRRGIGGGADCRRGRILSGSSASRLVIFGALICLCGCKTAPPPAAETKPCTSTLTPTERFDLRTKCADMVDKQADVFGAVGIALTSDVTSHYNPDTNRCYAEAVATKNFSYNHKEHPIPDNYRTTALYDAQTKQQLIFADQEGEKSHANDFSNKAGDFEDYDKGIARIEQLMQDDSQP